MEIELSGEVRGETVRVRWCDGTMAGSDELLRRLEPMLADGRCDPEGLTSVIRCIEQVAGQRMKLRIIDERVDRHRRLHSAA
jgi:hypothetical protein